jgi:hypothetical protein
MSYVRIATVWQGGPGGPGLTTFNCLWNGGAITATLAAVRAYWQTFALAVPAGYSCQVQASGDLHSEGTGALEGSVTGTQPAVTTFTGAGVWAAGVGAQTKWITGSVFNGHRVNGRTFLVPLVSAKYSSTGDIESALLADMLSAGNPLISALDAAATPLGVWSKAAGNEPLGKLHEVFTALPVDRVATLRSRRA